MARFLHILPAALVCALFFAGEGRSAEPYTPQHPDPVLEPWRWRIFAELKGAGLRALAEDGEGPLWFGLTKGVRRYDGLVWTDYTPEDGLVSAPVNVLAAGRDGTIYAGSDMGISQFRDGAWSRLFPPEGEVEDSGAGIAAEEMGTLFDAFVQTDSGRRTHEGSGLGLPISQQLVRMMGGEIEVESAVGQG